MAQKVVEMPLVGDIMGMTHAEESLNFLITRKLARKPFEVHSKAKSQWFFEEEESLGPTECVQNKASLRTQAISFLLAYKPEEQK